MRSKKSSDAFPFMVRYLTTNGKSDAYDQYNPFALRYRRVNETFYEFIKKVLKKREDLANKKFSGQLPDDPLEFHSHKDGGCCARFHISLSRNVVDVHRVIP